MSSTDLLILGSGVAGLSAAVHAARAELSVTLLTKAELGQSTTRYAQGGIGAAMSEPDSPELHASDTIAAGAGLCDPDAARVLAHDGPAAVRELMAIGAEFDHIDGDGALHRGREGGHSVRRVLHAGGDATGAEVDRALVGAAQEGELDIREGWFATDLVVGVGRCAGVVALDREGREHELVARHTMLATGGAGQLYEVTTNPAEATGDGYAMALRSGAAVCDLEFVQFHPTALHHPAMPRPLFSEALRGEGAVLRDENGEPLMAGLHPLTDLAPRDVVARAMAERMRAAGVDHVWLDATDVDDLERRFPTLVASTQPIGLDPTRDWLPVAPAAHYVCGGVAVDLDGATTLPGLWALGEAAASGVHGANRLASNSLLDGLVLAARAVRAIAAGRDVPEPTGVLRGVPPWSAREGLGVPTAPGPAGAVDASAARLRLQGAMTAGAGVARDASGLDRLSDVLTDMTSALAGTSDVADHELRNLVTVARALVTAARAREESRGAHFRRDHPAPVAGMLGRFVFAGSSEPEFVPIPATRSRVS